MNGAIQYEASRGVGGNPDGIVVIDKVKSIQETRYGYRLILLSDGSQIRTRTTLFDLGRRINDVAAFLAQEQPTVCNIVALPEPLPGQPLRSGDKPRPLKEG